MATLYGMTMQVNAQRPAMDIQDIQTWIFRHMDVQTYWYRDVGALKTNLSSTMITVLLLMNAQVSNLVLSRNCFLLF